MSKLSHSNPNLDDVLHEGNKHLALGEQRKKKIPIVKEPARGKINLGPHGEAACDAFDRDFDAFCDGEDDDEY